MQYDLDDVKIYAFNHTIKEVKNFFNFPSYEATKNIYFDIRFHTLQNQEWVKAILIADKVRGDYGL